MRKDYYLSDYIFIILPIFPKKSTAPHRIANLLGMMNIRYLLVDKPVHGPYLKSIVVRNQVELLENELALPLVYWVPEAIFVNDKTKGFQLADLDPIFSDSDE